MALNITSELELSSGITVATSYGRVAVVDQYPGNQLQSAVEIYATEADFVAGKQPIMGAIGYEFPYDRATDGVDILDIAHDQLIGYLAEQGITAVKVL